MLALPRRQSLIPPPGHANRPAQIPPADRPCWRPSAGKTLSHRRATPTVRPESRLPAVHVGASPPAKPYPTAGPRQQAGPNPACRPSMLAPPRRQSLIPPPGNANSPARIPLAGCPCWRCPAGKTLRHRLTTPTGRPESRPAAVHVGASPPATPYATAGSRQQAGPNPARQAGPNPACRPSMLAWSGSAATPFYTEIYKPTIFCLHLDRYGLKKSLPIKTVLKGNFFYEIIVLSMESCNI